MVAQVVQNGGKVDMSHFEMLKMLGRGAFGKVFLVRKVVGGDTGCHYAMKSISKTTAKGAYDYRSKLERDMFMLIEHPFIIKMHYAFQTAQTVHLVLDFCPGGDLSSLLGERDFCNETNAKFYLAELALAVIYLHSMQIIHRDLKPGNVLLGMDGHVVLMDFGLAKLAWEHSTTYTFCGTIQYMAPEMVHGNGHSYAADWWSFGVMAYRMMTNMLPFGQTEDSLATVKCVIETELELPKKFSIEAQNFVRALLNKDPSQRLGAGPEGVEGLKGHEFFKSINFEDLLAKKILPPFQRPAYESDDDSSGSELSDNSDEAFVSANCDNQFKGFSYVAPCLLEEIDEKPEPIFKRNILNTYTLTEKLSMECRGVWRLAIHKTTAQQFPIKIIDKSEPNCEKEIDVVLRHRHHPGICKLLDIYEDSENYYVVLQPHQGTTLLNYVRERRLPEDEAAAIFKTLVNTVAYLHQNGVVHASLKPNMIFFTSTACTPDTVTIYDMGFTNQLRDRNGSMVGPCWSANITPNVLELHESACAYDIWCLGVLLHIVLCGEPPFMSSPNDSKELIQQRICSGELVFYNNHWANVSQEAKMLVTNMLRKDPLERPTAAQVIKHPWLVSRMPPSHSIH